MSGPILSPSFLAQLAGTYSPAFLELVSHPEHCGMPPACHARGNFAAANGECVEFFMDLRGTTVSKLQYVFEGQVVVLAAAEAVSRMSRNMEVSKVLAWCTEDAIVEEIGGLRDSDVWGVVLVREALRVCCINALRILRDPWKGPYAR